VTIPLQAGIVYGPVRSRRLGASLGVNILPDARKVCNFNCPYCQYGWTPADARGDDVPEGSWPPPDAIAAAVEASLVQAGAVDRITLAGNGEPTLHPAFGEVVDLLVGVRRRRAAAARLAILSNASTLDDPAVRAALLRLDERYMKLDAGDQATLRALNGSLVPIPRIVKGLAALNGVILQSMFTRDEHRKIDNTTPASIENWLDAVRRITPEAVHIYTIDRAPAWKPLRPVPRAELDALAERVRAEGISAVVF
jgi:wyosine [tRNA(Phe)-imidazoG37] synthetase (radical SAM superfamily)